MKKSFLLISFLSTSVFSQSASVINDISDLDFFLGKWKIINLQILSDGSEVIVGESSSHAYMVLDNTAMVDEFRSYDRNGNIIFSGISVRSFNSETNKIQVVWIVPGKEILTDIRAVTNGDSITTEAKGYDERGVFLERLVYYDIDVSSYSMNMDRSYDNGETWIKNYGRFDAVKLYEEKK